MTADNTPSRHTLAKAIQALLPDFHEAVSNSMPEAARQAAMRKLDIRGDTEALMVHPEPMALVVFYGLYCFQRGGRTAAEEYAERRLQACGHALESAEAAFLEGILKGVRVTAFQLTTSEHTPDGILHTVTDLLDGTDFLLVSEILDKSMALGGRDAVRGSILVPVGDFHVAASLIVPFYDHTAKRLLAWYARQGRRRGPAVRADFGAQLTRQAILDLGESGLLTEDDREPN